MLKVKNLTHLSKKKIEKKAGILTTVARKTSSARLFLQPSVVFWLDFNQNFVLYRMGVISGC